MGAVKVGQIGQLENVTKAFIAEILAQVADMVDFMPDNEMGDISFQLRLLAQKALMASSNIQ